jgi:nitronate monooxygenase
MKWPRALADRLGIRHPIIQAPMAGGVSTPALAAAVSEAGGLGSLGVGYLAAAAVREQIRATRALTAKPFAVNLFVPEPPRPPPAREEVERARAALAPFRAEVGLADAAPAEAQPFREQLEAVIEERVPVVSFTFGALSPEDVTALARAGSVVLGTATTVREARTLEASGVHGIVAQGGEAGGHRGTFLGAPERAAGGTLSLVPQIVDAIHLPVVAAGGIMDGRAIAAAFALGADAVQLGTAFIPCPESGASRLHKEALLVPREEDDTVVTRAFSGKPARGLRNRFAEAMERAPLLPYPLQNAMTADLRREAARAGKADLLSLWAGQGVGLSRSMPAGELLATLVRETEAALARLGA